MFKVYKTVFVLFCDIVDNFGDAGSCFRLARALKKRGAKRVIIYTNNAKIFSLIQEKPTYIKSQKSKDNIKIFEKKRENSLLTDTKNAVVIEMFGTSAPIEILRSMINKVNLKRICLDYLSTENWTDSLQGMCSPDLRVPLNKTPSLVNRSWYAPGFTKNSAGIIWENRELASTEKRKKFRELILKQKDTKIFGPNSDNIFIICNFVYTKNNFPFNEKSFFGFPVAVWSPKSIFFSQNDFDIILQSTDFNVVRGEDSFVTAHFASASYWKVPFVWQPYYQDCNNHRNKFFGWKKKFSNLRNNCFWMFAESIALRREDRLVFLWSALRNDWVSIKKSMSRDCSRMTTEKSLLDTIL
jgi:hypothetical protein